MSFRTALPKRATTITPGYPWRIGLDLLFSGGRPDDLPHWGIRLHVWGDNCVEFSCFATFDDIETDAGATRLIPFVEMSAEQTASLRTARTINYVIDIAPPDGEPKDYFAGAFSTVFPPPMGLTR